MKLQRQHFSPQLFKDPECWSGRSFELTTSHVSAHCTTKWATGAWWHVYLVVNSNNNLCLLVPIFFLFSPRIGLSLNLRSNLLLLHQHFCLSQTWFLLNALSATNPPIFFLHVNELLPRSPWWKRFWPWIFHLDVVPFQSKEVGHYFGPWTTIQEWVYFTLWRHLSVSFMCKTNKNKERCCSFLFLQNAWFVYHFWM